MEPRGFEPLTSAVQRRHDTLLDVSGVCKISANTHIPCSTLFLGLQSIHSGCCTVAAQMVLTITAPQIAPQTCRGWSSFGKHRQETSCVDGRQRFNDHPKCSPVSGQIRPSPTFLYTRCRRLGGCKDRRRSCGGKARTLPFIRSQYCHSRGLYNAPRMTHYSEQ